MPAKKTVLTDEERAKRIRETAREIGTDNTAKTFDTAFKRIMDSPKASRSSSQKTK